MDTYTANIIYIKLQSVCVALPTCICIYSLCTLMINVVNNSIIFLCDDRLHRGNEKIIKIFVFKLGIYTSLRSYNKSINDLKFYIP